MAIPQFKLRTLIAGTAVAAVASAICVALAPRNLRAEAERVAKRSRVISASKLAGDYFCGSRGWVYDLSLASDGTYDIQEHGCFGLVGSAAGTWSITGNILSFNPMNRTGSAFSLPKWALVTEENGYVVLTLNTLVELYLDNGYRPSWSLTKAGDAERIRERNDRRTSMH